MVVFVSKESLLTANFETGFQNFVLALPHWEINPNQDAPHLDQDDLRELMEWNPCKISRGLALDLNASQITIYRHFEK